MINSESGKTLITLGLTIILAIAAQKYIVFDEEILIAFAFVCFVLFVYSQVKQSVIEEFASYSEKLSKDFFIFQDVLLTAVKKLRDQLTKQVGAASHAEEIQYLAQNLLFVLCLLKKQLASSLQRLVRTHWNKLLEDGLARERLKFQGMSYELLASVAVNFIQKCWYFKFSLAQNKPRIKSQGNQRNLSQGQTLVVTSANLPRLAGVLKEVATVGFGQRSTPLQKDSLNKVLALATLFKLDPELFFCIIYKA